MHPQKVIDNLIDLSNLKDGWYNGEGIAMSGNDIQWLITEFIEHFSATNKLPACFPTVEGNIQLEWCNNEHDLSIEVYRDTKKGYLHYLNLIDGSDSGVEINLGTKEGWYTLKSFIEKYK